MNKQGNRYTRTYTFFFRGHFRLWTTFVLWCNIFSSRRFPISDIIFFFFSILGKYAGFSLGVFPIIISYRGVPLTHYFSVFVYSYVKIKIDIIIIIIIRNFINTYIFFIIIYFKYIFFSLCKTKLLCLHATSIIIVIIIVFSSTEISN